MGYLLKCKFIQYITIKYNCQSSLRTYGFTLEAEINAIILTQFYANVNSIQTSTYEKYTSETKRT